MSKPQKPTSFFQTCLGVFQGGGCCAAALVGAYESAVRHGVQFIEVAGTSAGSIVAALVGAGATPDQLQEFIYELDFKRFMAPPEPSTREFKLGWLTKRAIKSYGGQDVLELLTQQGMHSSAEVETWVSECLAKLLPKVKPPVTFDSLVIPTAVVATDLLRNEVKVWSSRTTKNDGVAHAVRASCSIPLFFQPVDGRYVDGGALSNLPTFVFYQDRSESDRPLASRILALALRGDEPDDPNAVGKPTATKPVHPLAYFKSLASTIVAGSVDLQLGIQRDVHTVPISTGNIQATDFEKMDKSVTRILIKNGTDGADAFFRDELSHVRGHTSNSNICYGNDETYTAIVEMLDRQVEEILIVEEESKWVYAIFPSLLAWRAKGVRIRVVLQKAAGNDAGEGYRRRLLRAIGSEVSEHVSVPVRAYLFDPRKIDGGAVAIVRLPEHASHRGYDAVRYEAPIDAGVIAALQAQMESLCHVQQTIGPPKLVPCDEKEVLKMLKKVPQYQEPSVVLQIQTVKLDSLVSLTHYVREFKYRQIIHLNSMFASGSWSVFEPLLVQFADNRTSILTPPVVEDIGGDRHAIIEGSTRTTFIRNERLDRIRCVVATGVKVALPAKPLSLNLVRIVGKTLDVHKRYEQWDYNLFRRIEETVHHPSTLP